MQIQFNLKIMQKQIISTLFYAFFTPLSIFAQIIVAPTFPRVDDNVTITYDATQGNAALTGVSPIYIHTGAITDINPSTTAWTPKYPWATNAADNVLTALGSNKHSITYNIRSYYGIPASGVVAKQLAMIFRNGAGTQQSETLFYDVWDGTSLVTKITTPSVPNITVNVGDAVNFVGESSVNAAHISVRLNGSLIKTLTNTNQITHTFTASNPGLNTVLLKADDGSVGAFDKSFTFYAAPVVTVQNGPADLKPAQWTTAMALLHS